MVVSAFQILGLLLFAMTATRQGQGWTIKRMPFWWQGRVLVVQKLFLIDINFRKKAAPCVEPKPDVNCDYSCQNGFCMVMSYQSNLNFIYCLNFEINCIGVSWRHILKRWVSISNGQMADGSRGQWTMPTRLDYPKNAKTSAWRMFRAASLDIEIVNNHCHHAQSSCRI